MAKKKSNFSNNFPSSKILLGIIVIIILGLLIYKTQLLQKETLVPITSEELNASFMVPQEYKVTQKFNTITIDGEKGTIKIDTYGSLFNDLDMHINDLAEKNNNVINIIEKYPDTGYQLYKIEFERITPDIYPISYMLLTDYRVYTFQTQSEVLLDDLEEIAKSFRYNP